MKRVTGDRLFAAAAAIILAAILLGLLTFRRNLDYRDPVMLWESAVAADPANPRAYLALGVALMEKDRFSAAEAAFRRSIELSHRGRDTRVDSFSNQAMLLSLQGRDREALEFFEKTLEMNPDHPQALYNAATLRFNLFDPGEADFDRGAAQLQRLSSLLGTEHPRVRELRTAYDSRTDASQNGR